MNRLLPLSLMCALIFCSCGPAKVKVVTYEEFGPEFLQQVVERFTTLTDKPVECKMVHVLWSLEAHIPSDPNNERPSNDFYTVLCLCEGKFLGSGKETWRLLQLKREVKDNKAIWSQVFRVDTNNEGEFRGARNYSQKPTLDQFNRFVERARLDKEIAFQCQKIEYSKTKSHMYYIEAKPYKEECYELFGSTPACLKDVTFTWHANEPKPDIKLPAETKRSGFLDTDE